MAFGLSELVKNVVKDFTDAFNSLMGNKDNSKKYPNNVGGTTVTNITNTPSYEDGSWRAYKSYGFRVCTADNTTAPASGWKDFDLQINPQELTQDEIFAIKVTPTLKGVLVEHHGSTLKDITMSGTTGLSPLRNGAGGVKKNSGNPILASGHSGYEEFHELRSYIRAYVEAKRKNAAGDLRLMFINRKDSEYLFVEPQKFSMKRSKDRPLLYEYNIQLKGIGVATVEKTQEDRNFLDVVDDIVDNIEYGSRALNAGIDLLQRTERDIVDAILRPARIINQALTAIKRGQDYAKYLSDGSISRKFVAQWGREIDRIGSNYNDILGRNIKTYDQATGRTPTIISPVKKTPTYSELYALNGLMAMRRAALQMLSRVEFFAYERGKKDALEIYRKETFSADGISSLVKNPSMNINTPNSVRVATIDGNDTIQTLAARELGSPDAYRDIVLLNNLKPPYISDTPAPGVLSPGDAVLIPSQESSGSFNGIRNNIDYEINKNLLFSEKSLGVDIRLSDDYDIVYGNFGDIDLVGGNENLAQAIVLRIMLDHGSLKRHVDIGTGLRIGEKTKDLNLIRSQMINSLAQDDRIESVPFLQLIQEGNTTRINMVVKPTFFNKPVPVNIEV